MNDIKNGWGRIIYDRGYVEEGFWLNGELIKKRNKVKKFTNGDVYKGDLKNNIISGKYG